MASGTITLTTQSVDYGGGRGAVYLYNDLGWSVDDNGNISFWSISSRDNAGGSWTLYSSIPGADYHLVMEVQVDYGGGWQTVKSVNSPRIGTVAEGGLNAISASLNCINQLGSVHLDRDCSMRMLYYANRTPAPTYDYPNAFPDSGYSAAVQVPVHVDVSWTATLGYDANGGSGAPSTQTHTQSGDSYTFTVSNTAPTRSWHRFEGWATSSSASSPSYHGGDSFTIQKSNPTRTLYAVWTEFYRPGEHKVNGQWKSHHRSGGACERKVNGTWTELRTIDGGVGTNDPPTKKTNGTWYNQRKIGAN